MKCCVKVSTITSQEKCKEHLVIKVIVTTSIREKKLMGITEAIDNVKVYQAVLYNFVSSQRLLCLL